MNDNYFPVRYSQLKPSALKDELLKRYELEESINCQVYDSGMNDIYIVKAGIKNYYLRISLTGMHEQCDYEEELYIINTLHEHGIQVATPVCCKDGSYIWKINAPEGRRYAVLFNEAKQAPSKDNIKKAYNLGCMVAKMHTIADEKDFQVSRSPIDLKQLAKKPLELIQPYLIHRREDYEFLCGATEKLCLCIKEKFNFDKPYYGYCHGDIHSGNVFFEDDKPKLFDFDCMGYGWRIYDISIYAWNETFSDEKFIESETWEAFLNGYNSIRELNDTERSSISVFAALRELWMMGLHADVMERNAGCSWYNDEYFNYQIGIFKLWYERTAL